MLLKSQEERARRKAAEAEAKRKAAAQAEAKRKAEEKAGSVHIYPNCWPFSRSPGARARQGRAGSLFCPHRLLAALCCSSPWLVWLIFRR